MGFTHSTWTSQTMTWPWCQTGGRLEYMPGMITYTFSPAWSCHFLRGRGRLSLSRNWSPLSKIQRREDDNELNKWTYLINSRTSFNSKDFPTLDYCAIQLEYFPEKLVRYDWDAWDETIPPHKRNAFHGGEKMPQNGDERISRKIRQKLERLDT